MAVGVSGRARSDGSIDAAAVVAGRLGTIGRGFDHGGKGFGWGRGLPDAPDAGAPGAAEPAIDLELGFPSA